MDFDHDNEDFSPQQSGPPTSASHNTPPKIVRNPAACDSCRRLKIKCDRPNGDGRCSACIARGNGECVQTTIPRRPRVKKFGKELLSTMESRIREMESVITKAISKQGKNDDIDTFGEGNIEQQMAVSDRLSIVILNNTGGSNFVGPSSGFSLFSPQGLSWISSKVGSQDLGRLVSEVSQLDPQTWDQGSWTEFADVAWSHLPVNQQEPMPSKEVAMEYVEAFFLYFNIVFPLFNRAVFEARFERQYSDDPPDSAAWYACFNVVLALGSTILRKILLPHPSQTMSDPPSEELSISYLRNATSKFIDLQFGTPSLMSVQAMIAIVILLQGSANPLSVHTLVATAVRLAHAIGLSLPLTHFGLSDIQINERRDVFWILYIIEKTFSIQTGRPAIIHDQDIGISLPKDHATISLSQSEKPDFSTFLVWAKLARIESRVYSELYSARSRTRSVLQRLTSVGNLDLELQKWLESVPIKIRPEHNILCGDQHLLPVIVLHYSYYHCLTTIHRASVQSGPWTSDPSDPNTVPEDVNLNPRVYTSGAICVAAARRIIHCLDYFKRDRPPPLIWIAVSQPLCASLTLFANILQHPDDPNAASDLQLIHSVTSLIGECVAEKRLYFATSTLWIFNELHRIARLFLAKHKQKKMGEKKEGRTRSLSPHAHSEIWNAEARTYFPAKSMTNDNIAPILQPRNSSTSTLFQSPDFSSAVPETSLPSHLHNAVPVLNSQDYLHAFDNATLFGPGAQDGSQHLNTNNSLLYGDTDFFNSFSVPEMDEDGLGLDYSDDWFFQQPIN